jgi:hypothetical protein
MSPRWASSADPARDVLPDLAEEEVCAAQTIVGRTRRRGHVTEERVRDHVFAVRARRRGELRIRGNRLALRRDPIKVEELQHARLDRCRRHRAAGISGRPCPGVECRRGLALRERLVDVDIERKVRDDDRTARAISEELDTVHPSQRELKVRAELAPLLRPALHVAARHRDREARGGESPVEHPCEVADLIRRHALRHGRKRELDGPERDGDELFGTSRCRRDAAAMPNREIGTLTGSAAILRVTSASTSFA